MNQSFFPNFHENMHDMHDFFLQAAFWCEHSHIFTGRLIQAHHSTIQWWYGVPFRLVLLNLPQPNPILNHNPTNPNPSNLNPTFKMAALRNGGLTPVDWTVRTDLTVGFI